MMIIVIVISSAGTTARSSGVTNLLAHGRDLQLLYAIDVTFAVRIMTISTAVVDFIVVPLVVAPDWTTHASMCVSLLSNC
jgi:hypothetical protein